MKNNNGKRKPGAGLTMVGLLLIAAALFLTGKNIWDISNAKFASQAVLADLLPIIEAAEEKNDPKQPDEIIAKQETIQETKQEAFIPDYILNPDMKMPTELIDGNEYIGIISIPDIDVVLPVMESWSYPNLKISPCRYNGTAYKENFVICAHNYEAHFGNLKYLDAGSDIIFTDVDGNEFRYKVVEIETLQPTAIEDMISGDWDLTLFTCTVGGASRVTVRCLLQEYNQ